jgi:hypothetical protein
LVRLAGNDEVPFLANRRLLPHERSVIVLRRHPAVLAGFLGVLASALAAAGFLTAARRKEAATLRAAWGASGIAFFLSAIRIYGWLNSYLVVTDIRLLYIKSLAGAKIDAIPLSEIRGINMRRSAWGRLLGYGTLVIKTAGRDEKIHAVPYPEQLYLDINGRLFPARDGNG